MTDNDPQLVLHPDGSVNWPESLGPQGPADISYKHDFVIHLAALGFKAVEIARRTGYTNGRLSILLNNTHVLAEVERVRRELMATDVGQQLRVMTPKALNVVHDILDDTTGAVKPNVRLHAALEVIAHTHGKPQQRIEHTDGNLRSLFELLDKQQSSGHTFNVPMEVPSEVQTAEEAIAKLNASATPGSPSQPHHDSAASGLATQGPGQPTHGGPNAPI